MICPAGAEELGLAVLDVVGVAFGEWVLVGEGDACGLGRDDRLALACRVLDALGETAGICVANGARSPWREADADVACECSALAPKATPEPSRSVIAKAVTKARRRPAPRLVRLWEMT